MIRGYDLPETLSRLFVIDDELYNNYGSKLVDYLGIYLDFIDDFGYECTPQDAIVFARTGADGDHFAFLTKQDTVFTLEEAPIVFIQPMDFDNPIKLVAKNIKDFLSLFITLKELYVLERFDLYQSKIDFIDDYKKNYHNVILEREEKISLISTELLNRIELRTIEDAYQYIKELNKDNV
ncbi:hypothetical protein GC102_28510 [Paenibacillus sp. LMG 31460]|uniref:SMI1/KNR4 family protein n=1 Tax=Paenibacillus germinis TaxID=2654979 RepID=A0ABX1ZBP9_9BACL|nr:hypothetical protein [Paenibacillus germinis]NOU89661.1 hypothetical protein [Paenibacillus germinis]